MEELYCICEGKGSLKIQTWILCACMISLFCLFSFSEDQTLEEVFSNLFSSAFNKDRWRQMHGSISREGGVVGSASRIFNDWELDEVKIFFLKLQELAIKEIFAPSIVFSTWAPIKVGFFA